MPVSLNNSKDVVANTVIVVRDNNSIDVGDSLEGKASKSYPFIEGTLTADNITVNTEVQSNVLRAKDADGVTVNDNLAILGLLQSNFFSAVDANQLTIEDNLTVTGDLAANTLKGAGGRR